MPDGDSSTIVIPAPGNASSPALASAGEERPLNALIGQVLDNRYLVEAKLGEGGMGVVFRARHRVIDKRFAIKVLRGDLAADQEMADRFLNEARAASSIGDPHIVDISDFGRLEGGATYFVMEFLDGKSLGAVLAEHQVIAVPRLLHVAKQMARGLASAHAAGIVHRDLKPDNVMLVARGDDPDFVKILDFGIAKVASSEAGRITRAGSVFGTPHYMSPEQAAGLTVDARTDVYALGIILYEMASGKVPFNADNVMGILTQHMYKAPAPFRALVPAPQEVPPGLEAIVLKCLAKKPEGRYASMEELAQDLERVERSEVPGAVGDMMARSGGFDVPVDYFRNASTRRDGFGAARPHSRRLWPWALAAALLAAAIVAGGVMFLGARPAGSATPRDEVSSAPVVESGGSAASARAQVTVQPVPEDAVVFAGAQKLGIGERQVTASADATVTVRVERAGFIPRTVVVDGREGRVVVALEAEARPITSAPTKVVTAPKAGAQVKAPAAKPVQAKPAVGPCPPDKFRDPFTGACH